MIAYRLSMLNSKFGKNSILLPTHIDPNKEILILFILFFIRFMGSIQVQCPGRIKSISFFLKYFIILSTSFLLDSIKCSPPIIHIIFLFPVIFIALFTIFIIPG